MDEIKFSRRTMIKWYIIIVLVTSAIIAIFNRNFYLDRTFSNAIPTILLLPVGIWILFVIIYALLYTFRELAIKENFPFPTAFTITVTAYFAIVVYLCSFNPLDTNNTLYKAYIFGNEPDTRHTYYNGLAEVSHDKNGYYISKIYLSPNIDEKYALDVTAGYTSRKPLSLKDHERHSITASDDCDYYVELLKKADKDKLSATFKPIVDSDDEVPEKPEISPSPAPIISEKTSE